MTQGFLLQVYSPLPSFRPWAGIQPTCVCAARRLFPAQRLGLAGCRIKSGVTDAGCHEYSEYRAFDISPNLVSPIATGDW